MKKSLFAIVAALSAVFVFSACSSTEEDPYRCSDEFCNAEDLEKIVIQPDLKDSIIIHSVKNWKTENGNYEVAINGAYENTSVFSWIFNSYNSARIKYRIVWVTDKNVEVPVEEKTTWRFVSLMPNASFGAIYIAPNKNCKNFKFYIQKVTEQEWRDYAEKQPSKPKMIVRKAVKPVDKKATPAPVQSVLPSGKKDVSQTGKKSAGKNVPASKNKAAASATPAAK